MACRAAIRCRDRRRAGSVLFLVVVAMAVAIVLCLTFLSTATTTTGIARAIDEHAHARLIAESGLALATSYVERTPEWRDIRSVGAWINDMSLLGGRVSVVAEFDASTGPTAVGVGDSSFELPAAELPTPPVSPPMSGAVGGWEVQRQAAVETGPTVPAIGTRAAADSTDGEQQAFIGFGPATVGSGVFGQTLAENLRAEHRYALTVDVKLTDVVVLDSSYGFRILAGGTLVASTAEAATLLGGLTTEEIVAEAEAVLEEATEPSTLTIDEIAGPFDAYTLTFSTGAAPPPGPIRIELFAESAGGVSEVAFDDVRLSARSNEPLELTATGEYGSAGHAASATIVSALDGSGRVIRWAEP